MRKTDLLEIIFSHVSLLRCRPAELLVQLVHALLFFAQASDLQLAEFRRRGAFAGGAHPVELYILGLVYWKVLVWRFGDVEAHVVERALEE